jgi:N-terminal domain of anti-restriction factor ArdC
MNTTTTSNQRSDLYSLVTDRVVADLERGARPRLKPWTLGGPGISRPRRHNAMLYRGINVLLLWAEAIDRGYSAPLWMTYRQALELGGHVRQGEHGRTVVYPDRIVRKDTDGASTDVCEPPERLVLRFGGVAPYAAGGDRGGSAVAAHRRRLIERSSEPTVRRASTLRAERSARGKGLR